MIQDCYKALETLKYFCEETPDIHIVVAGSLLGLSMHSEVSYPVGKVEELQSEASASFPDWTGMRRTVASLATLWLRRVITIPVGIHDVMLRYANVEFLGLFGVNLLYKFSRHTAP